MKKQDFVPVMKKYRNYIILGVASLVLILAALFQYLSFYSFSAEENADAAFENRQRVLFDVESGKLLGKDGKEIGMLNIGKKEEEELPPNAPEISIIISELGVNLGVTKRAIELPKNFGLAFSPYSSESLRLSTIAKDKGHQVFVNVPFAKPGAENTERFSLSSKNNIFKNKQNFRAALSKVQDANGIVLEDAKEFVETGQLKELLAEISVKKLFIVHEEDIEQKISKHAETIELRYQPTTLELEFGSDLEESLKKLEEIATEKGYALGVVKPYASSILLLEEWEKTLKGKGIRFAPVAIEGF